MSAIDIIRPARWTSRAEVRNLLADAQRSAGQARESTAQTEALDEEITRVVGAMSRAVSALVARIR